MSCPRVHMIVRLVGGELTDAQQADVLQHVATCPDCAAAYQELRETWGHLGAWNIDLAGADITDRVLAAAEPRANQGSRPLLITFLKAGRLRVAASVLLAAGLGVTTGALLPRDQSSPAEQPLVTPDEVAESLGLVTFATQSATGLPLGFEPDALADGEGES